MKYEVAVKEEGQWETVLETNDLEEAESALAKAVKSDIDMPFVQEVTLFELRQDGSQKPIHTFEKCSDYDNELTILEFRG